MKHAVLDPAPAPGSEKRPAGEAAGWLVGPLLLSATLAASRLVLRGPDALFLWAVGAMVLAAIAWILVSVLFPAAADRTCPRCARSALVRLDPATTRGLACESCGWRDESASSFLLAEEEGPLEEIVLAERGRGGLAPSRAALGEPAPSSARSHTRPLAASPAVRGARAR